jgi:hypothetical protein
MSKLSKPSIKPLFHGDMVKRANLFRFIREFIESQNLSGSYMEFGVLNGECMIDAFRQFRGVITHYYGFDSFEGLPDLSVEDHKASEMSPHFRKGNFKSMARDAVRQTILASSRISEEELTLVQGFFSDSLPEFSKERLKSDGAPLVVYIDCDLYSSTLDVLRFIDDIVVTGTWVLFDDFWCYRGSPNEGEQRAVREWLESNKRIGLQAYCNFDGFGRAFIAYEK